jgi:hypothetical protein
MNNIADFLTYGIGLPELDNPPQQIDGGATCAITGAAIEEGYPVQDIISKSTGEYLDLLEGYSSEWLSESAARAFKGSWNMGSRLIFEDGTNYHPLVARKEAQKQERACWSDLVREIWPEREGQRLVMILTTDFKKRIWPRGRVGVLGESTEILVHDMKQGIFDVLQVNWWPKLLKILDVFEEVYTYGFVKPIIASCLYSDHKTIEVIGAQATTDYEKYLQRVRNTNEFKIAMIIAQKYEGEK